MQSERSIISRMIEEAKGAGAWLRAGVAEISSKKLSVTDSSIARIKHKHFNTLENVGVFVKS